MAFARALAFALALATTLLPPGAAAARASAQIDALLGEPGVAPR